MNVRGPLLRVSRAVVYAYLHRGVAWSAILGVPTVCVTVWSERSIQLGLSVWAVPIALLWLFWAIVVIAWTEVSIEMREAERYRRRLERRERGTRRIDGA